MKRRFVIFGYFCLGSILGFSSCNSVCKSDRDCMMGEHCARGSCISECQNNSDCFRSQFCNHRGKCSTSEEDIAPFCPNNSTKACYVGKPETLAIGLCRNGKQTCVNGKWGPCLGQVVPIDEVCDGKDNDCDGKVDEELLGCGCKDDNDCLPGKPLCRFGICIKPCQSENDCRDVQQCKGGICQPCPGGSLRTAKEECNGKDDNCNGKADEGCNCLDGKVQTCGSDLGECKKGTQTCQNGSWGACKGSIEAKKEECNGKDDNCDGKVDETLQRACGSNVGECKEGLQLCQDGTWSICAGDTKATIEVCDKKDNDCDGQVDEDIPGCSCQSNHDCPPERPACKDGFCQSCPESETRTCGKSVGECKQGTQTCEGGVWGSCKGGIAATTEVCDGKDNDCDGQTDEGFNCPVVCSVDSDCKALERCCLSEKKCYPTITSIGGACDFCKKPCGNGPNGALTCVTDNGQSTCQEGCLLGDSTTCPTGQVCMKDDITLKNKKLGTCVVPDNCDLLKQSTCSVGTTAPYSNCCPSGMMCHLVSAGKRKCVKDGSLTKGQKGCEDYRSSLPPSKLCKRGLVCALIKSQSGKPKSTSRCMSFCKCDAACQAHIFKANAPDCNQGEYCVPMSSRGSVLKDVGVCVK